LLTEPIVTAAHIGFALRSPTGATIRQHKGMSSEVGRPSMPWPQFAATNPDLAEFGAERLTAAPAYLATIRADGSPRVHPVSPIVAQSGLYVFMEPTSPKAADLRGRRRFALHSGVPDNAGSGGEFHVSGCGRLVDDVAIRAEASAAASYSPVERYILFELQLTEARANGYGDVDLPAQPRWTAALD
jgi:hypothetical protein